MTNSSGPIRPWVDQEDARKLHAEINQLSNQRFLVTTLSITVFVTANSALISRISGNQDGLGILTVFSLVLEIFLFSLSHLSDTIRHISRCEATFLVSSSATHWEKPWRDFRRTHTYSGFAKVQTRLFALLIASQALLPFIFSVVFGWRFQTIPLLLPPFLALFLLCWIFQARRVYERKEDEAIFLWSQILNNQPSNITGDQDFSNGG